jgi:hypothetical protein
MVSDNQGTQFTSAHMKFIVVCFDFVPNTVPQVANLFAILFTNSLHLFSRLRKHRFVPLDIVGDSPFGFDGILRGGNGYRGGQLLSQPQS